MIELASFIFICWMGIKLIRFIWILDSRLTEKKEIEARLEAFDKLKKKSTF